jgi:predicted esterase
MSGSEKIRSIALATAILASPVAFLAALLLAVASAWHSRLFAIALLAFLATPAFLGIGRFSRSEKPFSRTVALLPILGAMAALASWFLSPTGSSPDHAAFRTLTIDESGKAMERDYNRWSAANLVAEVDQLALGNALVPLIDPFIDRDKSQRIKSLFGDVYREMRANSPAHIEVGSDLGSVYRDIAGWKFQNGHGYVYVPKSASAGEAVPVFLFLHGSLGNFKGYLRVLQSLAEKRGMAIVAPSFGVGKWDWDDGLKTIKKWIAYCEQEPALDGDRIVLAGLSNGGRGVTTAWAHQPGRFRGIVCFSPILKPEGVAASRTKAGAIPFEPVLVIHGDADLRIPETFIRDAVQLLKDSGFPCDYQPFPGEDHFLFFSERDAVIERVDHWIEENAVLENKGSDQIGVSSAVREACRTSSAREKAVHFISILGN